ncbi:MAG TPA: hypothetical protein VNK49_04615 [Anaerolineales bacterium]|nr:hypothetical protein [Anaerolineales bacterium]
MKNPAGLWEDLPDPVMEDEFMAAWPGSWDRPRRFTLNPNRAPLRPTHSKR